MFFRKLDAAEEESFRQWARDNWAPGKDCSPVYHPVVREEWAKLDNERMTQPDRKGEE